MKKYLLLLLATLGITLNAQIINFSLKLSHETYILGEPISATIRILNKSPKPISISPLRGFEENRLFFEIAKNHEQLLIKPKSNEKLIKNLILEKDDKAAFEFPLSDLYKITDEGHYTIKAVLICDGFRYESKLSTFSIVPGLTLATAAHYIPGRTSVERRLILVHWEREGHDIAFLRAQDSDGTSFRTITLGDILSIKKPSIEEIDATTFYIHRQANQTYLARTKIISNKDGITLDENEQSQTSGAASPDLIEALRKAGASSLKKDKEP